MQTMSSSNRSQLAYKLEGDYPTNFGEPQGGDGVLLNMLSESLDYSIKTESSKAIRGDRQVADLVQVGATAQGGFNFEHQYREYDPFLQGVLQGDFAPYGADGLGAAIAELDLTGNTITATVAPAGSSGFVHLAKGQWFSIRPDDAETDEMKAYLKSRCFRVSPTVAPTGTVITLDPATPFDTAHGAVLHNASISSAVASNGNTVRSYTFEVRHEDINQFRQYRGFVVSKMDIKLSVGAIVTGTFDFMGKSFKLLQATSMGASPAEAQAFTPANATRGVFDVFEGGESLSATTYIKSADISIDNSLRVQDAIGVFGTAGIAAGTMKITGKQEVYFTDEVMYQKMLDGVSSSFSLPILDVDGNGYVYHFPRIKYTAAKVAVGGQDQDNMLSMDWQALPDITPGSPTFGKTVLVTRVGA